MAHNDLDKAVKDILKETIKKDSKVYTNGNGVGLNLYNEQVKKALLNTIKHHNKNDKKDKTNKNK